MKATIHKAELAQLLPLLVIDMFQKGVVLESSRVIPAALSKNRDEKLVGKVVECGWAVSPEVCRRGEWVVGLLDVRKVSYLYLRFPPLQRPFTPLHINHHRVLVSIR